MRTTRRLHVLQQRLQRLRQGAHRSPDLRPRSQERARRAEPTRPGPLAKANFDSFNRAAEDYRKKSREFLRCLRDAPAKAKTPNGKVDPDKMGPCPDGRKNDVVNKYNDFIHTSNDHQFP